MANKITKYKKKDGKTYYKIKAYLGMNPETGTEINVTRQGFASKKEAELALSRLKVEFEERGYQKANYNTFAELYELWFDVAYKDTVKESTYVKTQELFKHHILPAFGHLRAEKITVTFCQKKVNEWCNSLAKYRIMKNYVTRVLDYAISLDLIRENPMRKIIMPKRKEIVDGEKVENFYNKEELQNFLSCIKEDGYMRWYALFRLLAFTGFRKGEALALQWKDIDFVRGTVTVNKTLARGENNSLIIQTPKTKTSVRTIAIDEVTLKILKEWRKEQSKEYLKLGFNTMAPTQVVFTTYKNEYMQHATVTNRINKIIKKHDLKTITVHGLRHTHCSLLFEAGLPIQEVKERLGHSDIKTTMNIYTHVTKKAKEKSAEKFAAYVGF
ncbi:site-specific integrase [Trichococcus sp. K1Tr]|uniref:site-specific integrase n=1 Tax=Trichococcus sp. K1Tr TaxID=3020847 RepID=UPI00232FE3A4|nr:site-specific integrase [Trichococcus sp. K1Tr]MDB6353636.1 site-specific integrase [Trichococcus sp. K1Tr]